MEIISYVQGISRPERLLRKPAKTVHAKTAQSYRSRNGSDMILSFPRRRKSFSAARVRPEFSLRSAVMSVGHILTEIQTALYRNRKKAAACSAAAVLAAAASCSGAFLLARKTNFTGPLDLERGISDTDSLNALMEKFALEKGDGVDSSGNLIGSGGISASVLAQPVTYQNYRVKAGDTISGITKKFGLRNISTLISVNDIGNVRQLAAGQKLRIPSADGILYTVRQGDTIDTVVRKFGVKMENLLDVNELSSEKLAVNQSLFIPGVGLDSGTLRSAMGDQFKMPISAPFRWTSPFGWRTDPIAGVRAYHKGTDMACPTGTPIMASMSGKVIVAGVSRVYGNYVIINHDNGYQTLYGHMSKITATKGQWVSQGTIIGLVGSTGYSTGPHLHFTVYKNGALVDPRTVLKN